MCNNQVTFTEYLGRMRWKRSKDIDLCSPQKQLLRNKVDSLVSIMFTIQALGTKIPHTYVKIDK